MMDPISLTASTIAFFSAAKAAKDLAVVIYRFSRDASLARHDMISTEAQLRLFNSSVSSAYSLLDEILRKEAHSSSNPRTKQRARSFREREDILSNIEQVSDVLSSSLRDIRHQIKDFDLRLSLIKYIKWTFLVKPRIARLRPDMNALQTSIGLIINVVRLEQVRGENNSSEYRKKMQVILSAVVLKWLI